MQDQVETESERSPGHGAGDDDVAPFRGGRPPRAGSVIAGVTDEGRVAGGGLEGEPVVARAAGERAVVVRPVVGIAGGGVEAVAKPVLQFEKQIGRACLPVGGDAEDAIVAGVTEAGNAGGPARREDCGPGDERDEDGATVAAGTGDLVGQAEAGVGEVQVGDVEVAGGAAVEHVEGEAGVGPDAGVPADIGLERSSQAEFLGEHGELRPTGALVTRAAGGRVGGAALGGEQFGDVERGRGLCLAEGDETRWILRTVPRVRRPG